MNASVNGRTGHPPPRIARPRSAGAQAHPARNLQVGLLYMAAVMVAATVAYVRSGWSLGDALYMVVITIYTVGYDEVRPIDTPALRAISICTIVFGCTGMIFLTGALVQFIALDQINQVFGLRRMNNEIASLRDHVIICGFGRIGQMLARGLEAGRAAFVILERDEARVEQARALGYLCLQEDATEESGLAAAGVRRAATLATVLPSDAANVFITLTARSLNPDLKIIARGDAASTENKLLQAGANRVVLPTHIGAERITEMILYEQTSFFLRGSDQMRDFDRVLRTLGLNMDMVTAAPGSKVIGQTIRAIELEAAGSFFIVQINRRDGTAITRPDGAIRLEAGDGLVLIGRVLTGQTMFEATGK
jgi:voltage-gated potassium channel Kch